MKICIFDQMASVLCELRELLEIFHWKREEEDN